MKKILGVTDIVLLSVAAILSIRQIPNAAPYGAGAIVMWVLAAFIFFIPLTMCCGEMATGWPHEGGLFVWVRESFGGRIGWFVAISYIICCIIYNPLMLQFMFSSIGYAISPALASNVQFIGWASIIAFWILTLLNLKGIEGTKKITNWGAILGIFPPLVIIVLLGGYWLLSGHPMATSYALTAKNWLPNFGDLSTVVFFSTIMYAYAGMEVSPMIAEHVKNPKRDFPKAMLIAGCVIAGLYILGNVGLNALLPANSTDIAAGIMQAMVAASKAMGLPWLPILMGILMGVGIISALNAWLIGPIYMVNTASGEHHIFGKKFDERDPETGAPKAALIWQAVFVTVLVFMTFISKTATEAYWTLSAMTTLFYFIPFLFLFSGYMILRRKHPKVERTYELPVSLRVIAPVVGFVATLVAVILSFVPPTQVSIASIFWFEFKLVVPVLILLIICDVLYVRAVKRDKDKPGNVPADLPA